MSNQVNIPTAITYLQDVLQAGLVPNLLGSPGVGKSDIVRQVAEHYDLKVIDYRLAQSDPTDLNGFPTLNEDRSRSHYAPPSTFPLAGDEVPAGYKGWLIFFDEMNSAPKSVQAAAYKVVLDRMIGEHDIHEKVAMVCAGNLESDKAIVTRLSTAMQSRMVHINLMVDSESWLDWAAQHDIDYRIKAYINYRPEILHKFDPNHDGDTFPCPRTWHFMSKLIKDWASVDYNKLPLLAGTIGEGPALEFQSFTDIFNDLPSIEDIIKNPLTVKLSEEPSNRYAVSSLVANRATDKNIEPLMEFTKRLPIEFQVITLQNIIKGDKAMMKQAAIQDWIAVNAKELV